MKMRKTIAVFMMLCIVLTACSSSSGDDTAKTYMFVTGRNGGTYYGLGTYMSAVWDKYLGSTTNVISTSGSVDNIEMLVKGDADIAFVQNDILYYALNGKELYEERKQKGLSVLANLYQETVQIVVNSDSEYQTVADLAGKTVAVGKYGTATEASARQILEACGVTYDQITVKYQTFSEAEKGLMSGSVDAVFVVSSLPSASVLEYSKTRNVRFLPVTATVASKLKKSCPFFTDGVIRSEIYDTDTTVSTLCIDVLLICRSDLSTQSAYNVVSTLFNNLDELSAGHIKGTEIHTDTAEATKVGSFHSGAKKYYDEQNSVPAE